MPIGNGDQNQKMLNIQGLSILQLKYFSRNIHYLDTVTRALLHGIISTLLSHSRVILSMLEPLKDSLRSTLVPGRY